MNLRVPGPTPCPNDVLIAVGMQMVNHRGPEFKDLIGRVTDNLKKVFQTGDDVLLLTASGTGAMEATVANTLSPGDRVLAVIIGVFGQRFAQIAEAYGMDVERLEFPFGKAADPDAVRQSIKKNPGIKAVLVTHNETSTGVTNDLEAIAQVVKGEFGKLLLVDAISSIGSIPLPVDKWQCDVVITGSQKGWMAPPGIAMASMSSAAWEAYKQAKATRFYFDFGRAKSSLENGQTPWTPAISIIYGLDVALQNMVVEGMDSIYQRHQRVADVCRKGIKNLGLRLFSDERCASNTVTAVAVPPEVDGKTLVSLLRTEHGVVVAGGQTTLAGKIFRVGHLGYVTEQDIQPVMDALAMVLPKVGFSGAPVGGG